MGIHISERVITVSQIINGDLPEITKFAVTEEDVFGDDVFLLEEMEKDCDSMSYFLDILVDKVVKLVEDTSLSMITIESVHERNDKYDYALMLLLHKPISDIMGRNLCMTAPPSWIESLATNKKTRASDSEMLEALSEKCRHELQNQTSNNEELRCATRATHAAMWGKMILSA